MVKKTLRDPPKQPNSKTTTGDKVRKSYTKMKPITRSSFSTGQATCLVKVGLSKTPYAIHQDLLYKYSGYFIRVFGGTGTIMLEARTKIVELEDWSPDLFSFVNEWLYTQEIKQTGDLTTEKEDEACSPTTLMYVDIWKLADYLLMPDLQNFIMKGLFETFSQTDKKSSTTYDLKHLIKPCYESTQPGSPLREWISHMFALGLVKTEDIRRGRLHDIACIDFLGDYFCAKEVCHRVSERGPLTSNPSKDVKGCSYKLEQYMVKPLSDGR